MSTVNHQLAIITGFKHGLDLIFFPKENNEDGKWYPVPKDEDYLFDFVNNLYRINRPSLHFGILRKHIL